MQPNKKYVFNNKIYEMNPTNWNFLINYILHWRAPNPTKYVKHEHNIGRSRPQSQRTRQEY